MFVSVNQVEGRNIFVFVSDRLKYKMATTMQLEMSRTYLIHTHFYVYGLNGGTKYAN